MNNSHPVSPTYSHRWMLLRALIQRWHTVSLHWREDDYKDEISSIEEKAKTTLPLGVRTWIQFIFTMVNNNQWLFRDCKEFSILEDHNILTLLVQGENDYYWAVKIADLNLPDPPVHGYRQDYENPERTFVYDRKIRDSVSAFALKYMLDFSYMFRSIGGYSTSFINNAEALRLLGGDFPDQVQIEDYSLFEMPGVIAILDGGQLHVQYVITPSQLPPLLKYYAKEKASCNGEQVN